MSLKLVIGEDFPRAWWMLDGTSPYADYSGYERSATSSSTARGHALVKGADRSLIVNNANKLVVSGPVFVPGKEYLPFSVEVFVRPIMTDLTNEAPIQIFGNDSFMDGIVIEGTVISFGTSYASTGEARCYYDLMDYQAVGAVATHTRDKNQLFINGDLVAEVMITPEQQADTFAAPGTTLVSGSTTGPNSLMLNSLSLYDTELDDDAIMTHYANAQDVLGVEDIALNYGGSALEFAPEGAVSPFLQIEYSSDAEWALGHRVDTRIDDGTLLPAFSQGVSIAGYWQTVIPLGLSDTPIYAANLIWEGTGAKVETSRDGIDWDTAQKAKALTTIPKGMNGEGEFLYVRVSFPGGVADETSSFDNMVFSLYASGSIPNFSGREVVLDKATPEADFDVIDFQENWGVELEGGSVTIKAPVGETGIIPSVVEVWGMKNGSTFTDNLGAATVYTNGGTSKAWANGEWQLRHYVFDTPYTGDIVFSGTGQIGHIVLYPAKLSAADIHEIYTAYVGKPKIEVEVDEVFDIHEFNGKVDIYEYDWGIESAG